MVCAGTGAGAGAGAAALGFSSGCLVRKESNNATVVFQPQSTTNLSVQPFTNNGTPITNTFEMPGNKGFMRIQAKPASVPVPPGL